MYMLVTLRERFEAYSCMTNIIKIISKYQTQHKREKLNKLKEKILCQIGCQKQTVLIKYGGKGVCM